MLRQAWRRGFDLTHAINLSIIVSKVRGVRRYRLPFTRSGFTKEPQAMMHVATTLDGTRCATSPGELDTELNEGGSVDLAGAAFRKRPRISWAMRFIDRGLIKSHFRHGRRFRHAIQLVALSC